MSADYAVPAETIHPGIELVGLDGNAFAVMGAMAKALRRAGNPPEIIDSYTEQAISGDYDHLLIVTMAFNGDLTT